LDAAFFCSARDLLLTNPHFFVESVALQLASRHPVYALALARCASDGKIRIHVEQTGINSPGMTQTGVVIHRLNVRGVPPDDAFRRTIREPLNELFQTKPNSQVFILVDALDEARRASRAIGIPELVIRADGMPSGVRWIVTCRSDIPDLLRPLLARGEECALSAGLGLERSREDVRRHLASELGKPELRDKLADGLTANEVADAVGDGAGNFLYVRYLLQSLRDRGSVTRASLASLPKNLSEAYLEFLGRLPRTAEWADSYAPILGVLAVAREGLTEDQLANFVKRKRARIRVALRSVAQFLQPTEGSVSTRRHTLYHSSFAEFLLNRDEAAEFWCDPIEAEGRIAAYYQVLSGNDAPWDDYGLRHFFYHCVRTASASAEIPLSELGSAVMISPPTFQAISAGLAAVNCHLTAEFVRTKADRLGTELLILTDLDIVTDAAARVENLAAVFRWTWSLVGMRGQLSHSLGAEAVSLLVLLGRTEEALDMIGFLDRNQLSSFEREQHAAREHVACALAGLGRFDEAVKVAQAADADDCRDILCKVAVRVARAGDRARAFKIAREGQYCTSVTDLCRELASEDRHVNTAIAIAIGNGSGPALQAVAVELARRDTDRAVGIARRVPEYKELSGQEMLTRGAECALASVAIAAASVNPGRAESLAKELTDPAEQARAMIGITTALTTLDPTAALEFLDRYRAHAQTMHPLPIRLALAFVKTSGSADAAAVAVRNPTTAKRRLLAIPEITTSGDFEIYYADLLNRVDLTPLCRCSDSHAMVEAALAEVEEGLKDRCKELGVEDLEDEFSNPFWGESDEYAPSVVSALVAAIGLFDLDRALAFLDWACNHLDNGDADFRQFALFTLSWSLARIDAAKAMRVQRTMRSPREHYALVAIVTEVSKYNLDQAIEVADAVEEQYSRTKAILLGIIGGKLSPNQLDRAREVLARFPRYVRSAFFVPPLCTAAYALAGELARYEPDRAIALAVHYRGREAGNGEAEGPHWAEVACGVAESDPERALLLARKGNRGIPLARGLLAVAARLPDRAWDLVNEAATTLREHEQMTCDDLLAATVLGPSFERTQRRAVRGILPAWDGRSFRHLAETMGWGDAEWSFSWLVENLNHEQLQRLLYWASKNRPGIVVELLAWQLDSRQRELALAPSDSDTRRYAFASILARGAQAAAAGVVAQADWRSAIEVLRMVSPSSKRPNALKHLLDGLAGRVPNSEIPAAYAAVVAETDAVRDPKDRLTAYDYLVDSLLVLPRIPASIVVAVLVGLARGDRENYLSRLPDLVRLVCRGRREATIRLAEDFGKVEELLS
jgi:hypothetical protein